jgi:tetratricopeptide (TPR) repeat protein
VTDDKNLNNQTAGLKEFELLRAKMGSLIDTDPAKAVEEARSLPSDTVMISLKASILVDAGSCVGDKEAVAEGVELFRRLIQNHSKRPDLQYNLANGLVALANQEPCKNIDWYLTTGVIRREARSHFQMAVSLDGSKKIAPLAYTNLGNALWKAHRWVEAYNAYTKALENDSTNAVAATGAVKVLLHCINRCIGDPKILLSVAARHLEVARQHPNRIKELAGDRAFEDLSKLFERPIKGGRLPDLSHVSEYEKFVASHGLLLSPTIEGLDPSLKRWDSLAIQSFAEPLGESCEVPPLFAMFNVLKSDFLLARFLAYRALSSEIIDSGFYSDTLDYAIYGAKPAMLTLAQRACMDVLDKIAVATTEYFAITGAERSIYFTNRWFTKTKERQALKWHPELHEHIKRGNTAIIALAEVSLDICEGGFLHEKKAYRHSSTHRFTVLHDLGCEPSRQSAHVDHCGVDRFESLLLESLQLVRAAILYFVEMIRIGETDKKARFGKTAPIVVPSHHWIRGEDEEILEDTHPGMDTDQ